MNKEYKECIDTMGPKLGHLAFWHNKTDDECIELAKDENGNLDAEQVLKNMLERDLCTSASNNIIEGLQKQNENI
jgi:hypothetical protein